MQWMNSKSHFGIISVTFHWLVALTVFGLYVFGWWMTELDYYDSWYKQAPALHKSIGILLFITLLLRLVWRFISPPPEALESHSAWETKSAQMMHRLLYLLLFTTMLCGYLISTADHRSIDVFDWFSIPATITSIPEQEEIAGWLHFSIASSVAGFAVIHALAALKHHFFDRDRTLRRIFGK